VVLKFLAPYLVRDEQAQLRFLNEARVTSALDHPNICNIYEMDKTADGRFFMAMAYHEGETLKKRMRGVPLAVKTTRDESGSSHRYLVARRGDV
jgi:serine/threonine-protein kinase